MISTKWSKQFCSEPLENIENYDKAVEWLRENGYPKASRGNVKACACGLRKSCYQATWRYV